MIFKHEGKTYKIPSIPQIANYNHALDLTCGCKTYDWEDNLKKWNCDGVYDGTGGLQICFTCKRCGERFSYHVRDNMENYAELGLFDEYLEQC